MAAPTAQMDFDEHNQPRHGHLEGGVTMDSVKEGPDGARNVARGGARIHGAGSAAQGAHLERGVVMESEETSSAEIGQTAARDVSRTWRSPVVDIDFGLTRGTGKGSWSRKLCAGPAEWRSPAKAGAAMGPHRHPG